MFRFRYLLTTLVFAISAFATIAQQATITGTLLSEENGRPLRDAAISIAKLKRLTTTDSAGNFILSEIPYGRYDLILKIDNSLRETIKIVVDSSTISLSNIAIRSAKNPTEQITNVNDATALAEETDSDEEGGRSQNISGILNAARDPYLSAAAFTFGALRFQLRGHKRDQQEVFMNGSMMNDAESGMAYWGQWGGLNDVFRNQQNTFGLAAAEDGIGGLTGVTSIDATAMNQRKQIRTTYSLSNRSYRNRIMFTYSTGLLKSGWAFSVSGSKRWSGEGFIPGTFYNSYSYYGAVSKKINSHSNIHFVTFGAPTQRGKAMPAIQEAMDIAGSNYYNPNWGWQDGKKRNARVSNSFQPMALLTYDYQPDENTLFTMTAAYQQGYIGNSALDWYNAQDPRPDYYRKLPSYYLHNPQGADSVTAALVEQELSEDPDKMQIDWDRLYQANAFNVDSINGEVGKRSIYMIGEDRDDTRKYAVTANFRKNVSEHLTIFLGEHVQFQNTESYRKMLDLLGGDYYVNLNQFAERTYAGNNVFNQNDLNNPNGIIRVGDRYNYNYKTKFVKMYAWGQAIISFSKIDAFIAARGALDIFSREGIFRNGLFSNDSEGKSHPNNFFTYATKAGLTYKISGRHYLFVNAAKSTAAPTFDNTYISPRTRNASVALPNVERVTSIEGGYIMRSPNINGRLTGFATNIEDATEIKRFYHEDHRTFVNYAMRNISTRHLGAEFALKAKISSTLSTTLVATWMQVFYTGRPSISIYKDNDTSTRVANEISYMNNYFVAAGPQSAYSAALNYNSPKYWYANISCNYLDRNYVDMNPARLTTDAVDMLEPGSAQWNAILEQERLPAFFTIDIFAGKSFLLSKKMKWLPFGTYLYINLGVNNILNNKNIMTGGFEQLRYDNTGRNPERFPAKYFYGQGINYFLNISLKF